MNHPAFAPLRRGNLGLICAASVAILASIPVFFLAPTEEPVQVFIESRQPLTEPAAEATENKTALDRWSELVDDHRAFSYWVESDREGFDRGTARLREALEEAAHIEDPATSRIAVAATTRQLAVRLARDPFKMHEAIALELQARELCKQTLTLSPKQDSPDFINENAEHLVTVNLDLAYDYIAQKRWADAESSLKSLVPLIESQSDKANVHAAAIYEDLGNIECQLNKYSEAEKYFLSAASLGGECGNGLTDLRWAAQVSMLRPPKKSDETFLRKLVSVGKDDRDDRDRVMLARYYAKFGEPQKAKKLLLAAIPTMSDGGLVGCGMWALCSSACGGRVTFEMRVSDLFKPEIKSIESDVPSVVDRSYAKELLRQVNRQLSKK